MNQTDKDILRFLLAKLHMDSLILVISPNKLKQALQTLLHRVKNVYDKAVERIENQLIEHSSLVKKVMS